MSDLFILGMMTGKVPCYKCHRLIRLVESEYYGAICQGCAYKMDIERQEKTEGDQRKAKIEGRPLIKGMNKVGKFSDPTGQALPLGK